MGWTIEFVLYDEAKTDYVSITSDKHSTEAMFDSMDFDPRSITSVDYYKQEPRFGKISLFADTWLTTNLGVFLNGIGNVITDTSYWNYVVRVLYNGNTEYVGYVRRDFVSYNKTTDEYTFRTYDSFGIIVDLMKEYSVNDMYDYFNGTEVDILLLTALNLTKRFLYSGTPVLDIGINESYNLISGVQGNNVPIYTHTEDTQLSNIIDTLSFINFDDWIWLDTITTLDTGATGWQTVLNKNVCRIYRLTPAGITSVVLMKYYQRVKLNGNDSQFEDHLITRYFDIESDVKLINRGISHHSVEFTGLEEQTILLANGGFISNNPYRNSYVIYYDPWDGSQSSIKAGLELATSNNLTLSIGDDFYEIDSIDGNKLYFTGLLNIENVDVAWGDTSMYSLVECLLFLNNLCLLTENNGDITIYNKQDNNGSNIISDADVLSFVNGGIIKKPPNYSGILSVIEDTESIALALRNIYSVLFSTLTTEINAEISNNYTLNVFDNITIYGDNYKISSIKLDNEKFIYTIKAWRL